MYQNPVCQLSPPTMPLQNRLKVRKYDLPHEHNKLHKVSNFITSKETDVSKQLMFLYEKEAETAKSVVNSGFFQTIL